MPSARMLPVSRKMSTPMSGIQQPSHARTVALKSAVSALAMVTMLGTVPAAAQTVTDGYAVGGSGKYRSQIIWFSWGAKGSTVSNAGLSQTNSYTVAGKPLTVTCSLSNISGSRTDGLSHFDVYAPGGWQGDGLDNLYNGGSDGSNNTMAIGLRNAENGARAEGDFACSATFDNKAYGLDGLVFADAEATAQGAIDPDTGVLTGEAIGITLPNAARFRFIEEYSDNCNTVVDTANSVAYQVTASDVDGTHTRYTFTTPDGNCENNGTGPMGVGFIEGGTSANFYVKGNGSQAIALGAMLYIADQGDAPASYGDASHVPTYQWVGGEVVKGTSVNIFDPSFSLAQPVQPAIRFGALVDVEATNNYSADADGDNNDQTSDEDALTAKPITGLLAPGNSYVLQNVSCTATNTTAPVYGYIDFNQDGDFSDAGERSALASCAGTDSSVDLSWTVPADVVGGDTYLRLRIGSTAAEVGSPTGVANLGEVEDHLIYLTVAQVRLVKTLTGRVNSDDQFSLDILQGSTVVGNTTTSGTGGGSNATAQTELTPVLPSSVVTLRETASGSSQLNDYTTTFSCIAGPDNRTAVPAATQVDPATHTLTVQQGNDLVCTYTNVGKPKVALTKTTEGGFGGVFDFTASNLPAPLPGISTTANLVAAPTMPTFQAPLDVNQPIVFNELPLAGYSLKSASCSDLHAANTGNPATVGTLVNGQLIVPVSAMLPGARLTCNFVNAKDAVLRLEKSLPRGRDLATDQFDLLISNGSGVSAQVTTVGANTAGGVQAVVTAPALGANYELSEAAAGTPVANLARYSSTWSCSNASQVAGSQAPSGTGVSFTVTPAPGDDLTCTFVNVRANSGDLSITKTNTPLAGPSDQTDDYVQPGTTSNYVVTITNNGPDAVTGAQVLDQADPAALTCPAAAPVVCTGDGCPTTGLTIGQLQTAPGLTLGTIANGATLTLSYSCQVR